MVVIIIIMRLISTVRFRREWQQYRNNSITAWHISDWIYMAVREKKRASLWGDIVRKDYRIYLWSHVRAKGRRIFWSCEQVQPQWDDYSRNLSPSKRLISLSPGLVFLISVSVSFFCEFCHLVPSSFGPFPLGPKKGAISRGSQQFSLDDNRRKKARRACAVRA